MGEIKQPRWKTVEYSRNQIIQAGKIIKKATATPEERSEALKIIDNWRVAHAYPLQVFYVHLKNFASDSANIIVAQRLKRLDSIVGKLEREPTMNLWTMQDLGGCRLIVDTVDDVYSYYEKYKNSRVRHKFVRVYDYIQEPKKSGYRSLHVVYEFHSDKKENYNRHMLIEIQFRTHLQHIWATAVETMGLFTNEAIKSGKGPDDVKRFFALVSSLFAIKEKKPVVPNTPEDVDELIHEIESINAKHNYLDFLSSIKIATKLEEDVLSSKYRNEYCILSLNYQTNRLEIRRFKSSDIEKANEYYSTLENTKKENRTDTVLVRVSSFGSLRKAYPNYFADISEFVALVKDYLK